MAKAQWFKFYPDKYTSGTAKLSPSEKGAYVDLLIYQFEKGSIPSDDSEIEEITGMKISKLTKVLKKFEMDNEGQLINMRMAETRKEANAFFEKQASNGSTGGRPPKLKTQTKPMGFENKTQTKPNDNPNETHIDKIRIDKNREDEEKEKEKENSPSSPIFQNPIQPQPFERIEFIANEFLTSGYYAAAREQLCIAKKITIAQLSQFVVDFNNSLIAKAEYEKQAKDWISHLGYWISKNQQSAAITPSRPTVKSAAEINRQRAEAAKK